MVLVVERAAQHP
jgi:hypothetical protein